MYLLDSKHHNLPHIHAKYGEFEASIGIEDAEILAGELPRKQLRLVQAWIELHRDELKAIGNLLSAEKPRTKLILCKKGDSHVLGCTTCHAAFGLPSLR